MARKNKITDYLDAIADWQDCFEVAKKLGEDSRTTKRNLNALRRFGLAERDGECFRSIAQKKEGPQL